MMLGRKKMLFKVGGRPVWLRECYTLEMQKREEKQLRRSKDSNKIQP